MAPLIEPPYLNTVIFNSAAVPVPITHKEMYIGIATCSLFKKVPTWYLLPGIFLLLMLSICVS